MDLQENHPSIEDRSAPQDTELLRIRTNPEDPSFIQVNISLAGVHKEGSGGMDGRTTMPANPLSPDR